ncbi:MAG: hypothetical protein Q9162_003204 [Coniocarpon cinnabarinum]
MRGATWGHVTRTASSCVPGSPRAPRSSENAAHAGFARRTLRGLRLFQSVLCVLFAGWAIRNTEASSFLWGGRGAIETVSRDSGYLGGFAEAQQKIMGFSWKKLAGLSAALEAVAAQENALLPLKLTPLALGSTTPNGWLSNELRTEAAGLAGNEYTFYDYVQNANWIGGDSTYSDLNEGFPYWFNGLVPLAYGLNDERLKSQVHDAATKVLNMQYDDGWLGPEQVGWRNFWGRTPFLLGLTNLIDANATWADQALPALSKFYILMHNMLQNNYTGYHVQASDYISEGDTTWGRVRYQDLIISLIWMYEQHADAMDNSNILIDNMNYLINGSLSWNNWYNQDTYIFGDLWTLPDPGPNLGPYVHGVNTGQGLKAPAVDRRVTHDDSLLTTASNAVNWTFQYHGAASGTVLADERIDGLSPWSGSELCTAVETMFSLSYLYQALGDSKYADAAERTAFNALPAMLTPDWWSHQYMAQPNQPYSQNLTASPFSSSGTYAQVFGLEPQYPCCTVNHPQGLPKYLMNSYAQSGDNAIAHTLLGPASVKTQLPGSGGQVSIDCETNYPFGSTLTYTITSAGAFDLLVRVPAWASGDSSIAVGNAASGSLSPDPTTGLHTVSLQGGQNTVTYKLGSSVYTTPRANDTVAVYNGALLYALDVPNSNHSIYPRTPDGSAAQPAGLPSQSVDWVFTNTSAWNYAIDPSTLRYQQSIDDSTQLPDPVFAPGNTGNSITARACRIDWPLWLGSVPGAPPTGDQRKCVGDPETVTLVPYGSAKTRMAELPTIDLGDP